MYNMCVVVLLSAGCSASHAPIGTAAAQEPPFSKLAGRWSISLPEMAQALGRDARPFKEVGLTERDRTVIVTIKPDGGFDWPRTSLGVSHGIHSLRNKGDRCTGRRYEAGRFEVVACEYTPTRSFIEFRGLSRDENIAQTLTKATLDVRLQANGGALARIGLTTSHLFFIGINPKTVEPSGDAEVTEMELPLRRHEPKLQRLDNVSKIAGHWAASPDAKKILITIRRDGTFDWTGTIEGMMGAMHQLEQKGDNSFNQMDPRQRTEVVLTRYKPNGSTLQWITRTTDPATGEVKSYTQTLSAKPSGDKEILVTLSIHGLEQGDEKHTAVLHGIEDVDEREESFTSRLRELAKQR